MPALPRDLQPLVDFEPLPISADTFISHPLNVADLGDFEPALKRRVDTIAAQFLAGRKPFIHTATLRGPFGNDWFNPWHRSRATARKAELVSVAPNLSSRNPTSHIPNAFHSDHARAERRRQRLFEGQQKSKDRSKTLERTSSSERHREEHSGYDLFSALVGTHLSKPAERNPASAIQATEPDVDRAYHHHRRPLPHLPKELRTAAGTDDNGILHSRNRRKENTPVHSADSLPTPSDSGGSEHIIDRLSGNDGKFDTTRSPRTVTIEPRSPLQLKPTALRAINKSAVAATASFANNATDIELQNVPDTTSTKRCRHCQTTESYQWRKGPDGPGTLCTSCGAKWTNKQKKGNSATELVNAHQSRQAKKSKPADSDSNTTANLPNKRRKYENYGLRRDSIKRAAAVKAREAVAGLALPSDHLQIYSKIFPISLEQMERDVNDRAVTLRQEPSPNLRRWTQPGAKSLDHLQGSFQYRLAISPRKVRASPGARSRSPAVQDECESSDQVPQEATRKRRQVNFDTPRPLRDATAAGMQQHTQANAATAGIVALSPDTAEEGSHGHVELGAVPLPEVAFNSEQQGVDSLNRSTTSYPSTQALMQEADNEFRNGLESPSKPLQYVPPTTSRSEEWRDRIRLEPDQTPRNETPATIPGMKSVRPASVPPNTQDLFAQAMSFGSSPTKRSIRKKKRASFASNLVLDEGTISPASQLAGITPTHNLLNTQRSKMRNPERHEARQPMYSPLSTSGNIQQQDAQKGSSPFDLDAAIDQGQGFLDI